MRWLDRSWRLIGTGLAFASLGLGGMFLAATIFPLISLATRDPVARVRRTQYVVHRSFRLYITLLSSTRIIDLDLSGIGSLADCRGCLIVANHPTLLDVVLLMSLNPRVRCIVKHQLWSNPYLGGVVRAAGYLRNDLPSETMIRACADALAEGSNLLVFPEGTRTRPGETGRFQRGFANVAMLTGAELRLALITCHPITLTKGEPWWRIPARRPLFQVADMGALDAKEYMGYQYRAVGARRLTTRVEGMYIDKLAC